MPRYLFQLGREPAISAAELRAVFSHDKNTELRILRPGWMLVAIAEPMDAGAIMNRLGGIIKIAELAPNIPVSASGIAGFLIARQPEGKIIFSLSGDAPRALAIAIKRALKEGDRSARYIESKNTATILHNHLVPAKGDLTIFGDEIFFTTAIQPIEEFSARDFGRPARDSRSGMLPPKLAKMMINLSGVGANAVLLDPFCGSGTILMEAALMGFARVIGADVSEMAIEDTKKNLEWLNKEATSCRIQATDLYYSDIRDLSRKISASSIDAIITEPSLGKPLRGNESEQIIRKQAEELKNLYKEAFRSFSKILKPGGIVIFIMPSFRRGNEWITTHCQAEIEAIGFAVGPLGDNQPYLRYHRPDQHLARDIWKFQKTK